MENDASAWLRSVVTKRGHNADLAENTIREAKAFTEKEALDDHLIDIDRARSNIIFSRRSTAARSSASTAARKSCTPPAQWSTTISPARGSAS